MATSGSQSVTPTIAGAQTYTIACSGSGGTANASSTITAATPGVSLNNTFSPNDLTIFTSEGGTGNGEDFWTRRVYTSPYGYGLGKVLGEQVCLTGQVSQLVSGSDCSTLPDVTGPLSPQMLSAIDARIASFARTGARLLLRFYYNSGPTENGRDAPMDLILTHIDQLAPILLNHRDLMFGLEAGFIGSWGEWHHSLNGNDSVTAHKKILDKELSYFKGVFPILVRYPAAIIQYTGSSTPQESLGVHDDYFASNENDGGTWSPFPGIGEAANYTTAQLMTYGEQLSETSLFKGEWGTLYPPLQNCAALDAYSHRFHVQLAAMPTEFNGIGPLLQDQGCLNRFINKVGTRIELQRATLIGNPTAGGTLFVALAMVNAGYGRVIRSRPATLVFISSGLVVGQVPISLQDLDLRQLASASTPVPKTFQFTVTVPPTVPSGRQVSIALLVPDPAPSLTAQAAYALPLNSLDSNGRAIFDSTTGYNSIGAFTSGATGQGNDFVLRTLHTIAQPLALTGNWSGESAAGTGSNAFMPLQVLPSGLRETVARLQGTPRITWSLKQNGATVTGTASVTLQGATLLSGTLTGTFANGALSYIVSVPEGGASIAPGCAGQIEGLATLTSTLLTGSAAVRNSTCAVPRPNVTFTLTKQ